MAWRGKRKKRIGILAVACYRSALLLVQAMAVAFIATNQFRATNLLPIGVRTKVHACAALAWETAICTVSSIGRASDS
jgi:hypothetical protein